ncbi:SHOCT domain-containing protein [Mycobacterium sp. HNNTM2301]|uniref:SHOCT domain-containing protein n=1 Tax=Mycobacterium hainanense TaxID=3289775 RepID=UPI0035A6E72A
MKSKVIVLLAGGMLALVLLTRYFALSRAGVSLGWMLYLGLPITGAGVLFALRLIDMGAGWTTRRGTAPRTGGIRARPGALPRPEPPLFDRLKQLEDLHARGAITDTEYSAQRLQIIADM